MRKIGRTLRFASRRRWRNWLEKNHNTASEVFLIVYKRAPKNASFSNVDAVEEALCFGWIDGWFKPIDADRWVIRYTPRHKGSSWSDYNIARAWKLLNEKKMTATGVSNRKQHKAFSQMYQQLPILFSLMLLTLVCCKNHVLLLLLLLLPLYLGFSTPIE